MSILDVNHEAKTASLSLYQGGVVLTTYRFADNVFTLAALAAVTLPVDAIVRNLALIDLWLAQITSEIAPDAGNPSNYDTRYERDATSLRFRYIAQGNLSDATCTFATGLVEVRARPQRTMSVRTFRRWIASWKHFVQLAQERG